MENSLKRFILAATWPILAIGGQAAVPAGLKPQMEDVLFDIISREGQEAGEKKIESIKASGFADVRYDASSLMSLGNAFIYRYFDFETGLIVLKWNLELFPKDPSSEYWLGEAYYASGDRAGAITHLKRALALNPKIGPASARLKYLNDHPSAPAEGEQLLTLLQGPTFEGNLASRPFRLAELQSRVEAYVATAHTNVKQAVDVTAKFLQRSSEVWRTEQVALMGKWKNSTIPEVADVAARAKAKDAQLAVAAQSIASFMQQPVELVFVALGNQQIDLAKWRGQPVLLVFFPSWGNISLKSLPSITSLVEQFRIQGVEPIWVALDLSPEFADQAAHKAKRIRTSEQILSFAHDNGIDWPIFYDGKGFAGSVAKQFWVDQAPRLILLDRDGFIASREDSYRAFPAFEADIRRALARTRSESRNP